MSVLRSHLHNVLRKWSDTKYPLELSAFYFHKSTEESTGKEHTTATHKPSTFIRWMDMDAQSAKHSWLKFSDCDSPALPSHLLFAPFRYELYSCNKPQHYNLLYNIVSMLTLLPTLCPAPEFTGEENGGQTDSQKLCDLQEPAARPWIQLKKEIRASKTFYLEEEKNNEDTNDEIMNLLSTDYYSALTIFAVSYL